MGGRYAGPGIPGGDDAMRLMTAQDIHAALRKLWSSASNVKGTPEWVYLEEVRLGIGRGGENEQQVDAIVFNCWPSSGMTRIAVEVKLSRADYTRELRTPWKRHAAYRLSNLLYFATPVGLLRLDEIPSDAGMIEVSDEGVAVVTAEAPWHESDAPTWRLVASLARRASRIEFPAAMQEGA